MSFQIKIQKLFQVVKISQRKFLSGANQRDGEEDVGIISVEA